MRNLLSFIFAITLSLTVLAAKADVPTTLYSDTVTVADQTNQVRNAAFATALSDVLIKTSGNLTIATNPNIASALKQAPQWVQSYHYSSQNNQLQLVVQFDPEQINQLLTNNKQALWEGARPQTLVWLGVINQGKTQLLGTDSTSPLPTAIINDGARNGLPLVFPLIDLQDLSTISFDNLVHYQPDVVRKASARYTHDNVLLVAITTPATKTDTWQANWTLLQKGAKTDWQTTATDENSLITEGMQQFSEHIFAQQASQPTVAVADNVAIITVYGIKSINDYSAVNDYLQQLNLIQSLTVATMAADHVIFNVTLNGTAQALNNAVTAGHLLTPAEGSNATNLIYQVNA